jgi:hypothetical protein
MKSYAEFLRGYIGKKGDLRTPEADEQCFRFILKKSPADFGVAKLVDVGTDYAEFAIESSYRIVPLSLLVLVIE